MEPMYPGQAPALVSFGMIVIALSLAIAFVWASRLGAIAAGMTREEVARRTWSSLAGVATWLGLFSAAAASGVLARFDARPPPFNLMFLLVLAGALLFARSRAATALVDGVPIAALVGFQGFRLPLELVMHEAARAGIMPPQMSYGGRNFDIVTGASAIVVAVLLRNGAIPRGAAVAWNALGALLLANVVTIAVLSTPMFHVFGPDALNTWVAYFPFVLLPTVMVPAAIVGHVLVARWLLRHPAANRAPG
jgi:hypothetical protein